MDEIMCFDELKEKALSLPYAPGVYIMRDKENRVIYVGKAKKLKNRVSQYFQDTASHTPKTRLMVSKIDHFDVIVAASEFEALVLECSLIKQHMPKYNILLKDDKGYPYIRLDLREEYPVLSLEAKLKDDGAEYFGPFGSRGLTTNLIKTILQTLMLPTCSKQFPRDLGKGRACLNYHMNQCAGWCQGKQSKAQYQKAMAQARQLLAGDFKQVAEQIRREMQTASDDLEFELAAKLRDQYNTVIGLGNKQLVTAGTLADTDVIGYGATETKACFAVLHFSGGNLLDKDYEVFPRPDDAETAVSSLMKQYYIGRGMAPKIVLLPFSIEDGDLFAELMEKQFGKKPKLRTPQRGDNVRMVELANKNAFEEAQRITTKEEKAMGALALLGKMLSLNTPRRIESYDISNISGTDIVAGMVVFEDGKPKKSQYKKFKLEGMADQNDYASMEQVLIRRFTHLAEGDTDFGEKPDLLLIDGGITHARVAETVLGQFGFAIPVFGMVKDDKHRTRALVTASGQEIAIDAQQAVFALVGNIQEETHGFAIGYHKNLRSKRLRYSKLDDIPGIGPKRKQLLLKAYGSLSAIGQATVPELERLLPADAAMAVYMHFHKRGEDEG